MIDYGRPWRKGKPISTSRAESLVNNLVNARMDKRRQMRWSPRGANRVLQVRAAVLDGRFGTNHPTRSLMPQVFTALVLSTPRATCGGTRVLNCFNFAICVMPKRDGRRTGASVSDDDNSGKRSACSEPIVYAAT